MTMSGSGPQIGKKSRSAAVAYAFFVLVIASIVVSCDYFTNLVADRKATQRALEVTVLDYWTGDTLLGGKVESHLGYFLKLESSIKKFRDEALPAGRHVLTFKFPGYQVLEQAITLRADVSEELIELKWNFAENGVPARLRPALVASNALLKAPLQLKLDIFPKPRESRFRYLLDWNTLDFDYHGSTPNNTYFITDSLSEDIALTVFALDGSKEILLGGASLPLEISRNSRPVIERFEVLNQLDDSIMSINRSCTEGQALRVFAEASDIDGDCAGMKVEADEYFMALKEVELEGCHGRIVLLDFTSRDTLKQSFLNARGVRDDVEVKLSAWDEFGDTTTVEVTVPTGVTYFPDSVDIRPELSNPIANQAIPFIFTAQARDGKKITRATITWGDSLGPLQYMTSTDKLTLHQTHAYDAPGQFPIKLVIENECGEFVESNLAINITKNDPPDIVINFENPTELDSSLTYTLSLIVTDPTAKDTFQPDSVSAVYIAWGDGKTTRLPNETITNLADFTVTHRYSPAGPLPESYTIIITAVDAYNNASQKSLVVDVQ